MSTTCDEQSGSCCQSGSGEVELNKQYALGKKRLGRGAVPSGLTHECGVFGAIATGEWPTTLEISQLLCWGLVALQHR